MPSSTIGLGPAFAFHFVEALVLAHALARLSFVFVYVRTTFQFPTLHLLSRAALSAINISCQNLEELHVAKDFLSKPH